MCVHRPGQVGLSKVSIQLVNKLTPIIMNGWFWECDQDRLPPQHGNIGEVRRCIGHSLAVSCKLMRLTIEGHDTTNCKGSQLRWLPTSELVGFGCFSILVAMTRGPCIVLLVGWPLARWIT